MRIVKNDEEFELMLKQAQAEALAGFNDDRMILEKFVEMPRYVGGRGNTTLSYNFPTFAKMWCLNCIHHLRQLSVKVKEGEGLACTKTALFFFSVSFSFFLSFFLLDKC